MNPIKENNYNLNLPVLDLRTNKSTEDDLSTSSCLDLCTDAWDVDFDNNILNDIDNAKENDDDKENNVFFTEKSINEPFLLANKSDSGISTKSIASNDISTSHWVFTFSEKAVLRESSGQNQNFFQSNKLSEFVHSCTQNSINYSLPKSSKSSDYPLLQPNIQSNALNIITIDKQRQNDNIYETYSRSQTSLTLYSDQRPNKNAESNQNQNLVHLSSFDFFTESITLKTCNNINKDLNYPKISTLCEVLQDKPKQNSISQSLLEEYKTKNQIGTQQSLLPINIYEDLSKDYIESSSSSVLCLQSHSKKNSDPLKFTGSINFTKTRNEKDEENEFFMDSSIVQSIEKTLDHLSTIPTSILKLHQLICNPFSEFAFICSLSRQMCSNNYPKNYMMNLKIALLLSIVSTHQKNQVPIPIITIHSESSSINNIMVEIGNYAQRFISTISCENACTGFMRNNDFIEAGPLQLAKTGVCYLGEWSAIKEPITDKILKQLERGRAFIEKSVLTYPINCAIWCYWSTFNNQRVKDVKMLGTILEIFGVPIALENELKSDDLDVIDFLLDQACSSSSTFKDNEFSVPYEDMKNYLMEVAKRKVEMSEEAKVLLQKYFVITRLQTSCTLTQKAFEILGQFSESFAKLCFHPEIIEDDVAGAIFLMEMFSKNLVGPHIYPPPEFTAGQMHNDKDIDIYFKQFKIWLRDYVQLQDYINL